jgi:hypothetical protein
MSDFSALKSVIRENLNDVGEINFSDTELNDSVQDGYDDVLCLTQCLVKKVTLSWVANLSYYDLADLVTDSDYLACVAIYDNVAGRWLSDNKTTRDFDKEGDDWELDTGTPENWAATSPTKIAVRPRPTTAIGTFDLYYWATAPSVDDSATPLIATDCQALIPKYSTADLLEQYEEFTKASFFWKDYLEFLEVYKTRVKNLVKTDLLIRI